MHMRTMQCYLRFRIHTRHHMFDVNSNKNMAQKSAPQNEDLWPSIAEWRQAAVAVVFACVSTVFRTPHPPVPPTFDAQYVPRRCHVVAKPK